MSFGDYLFGVVGLAAVAIPMALAAVRLRRRLLPGWEGAPARLAEAVLGVALLTVLLQLLGAFGILVPAVLIIASLAIGLGLWFGVRDALSVDSAGKAPRTEVIDAGPPPAPAIPLPQTVLALAAAAFVAAHWATGLQDVWGRGMLTFDTLWYHGPFAARFVHWIGLAHPPALRRGRAAPLGRRSIRPTRSSCTPWRSTLFDSHDVLSGRS